jgi:CHASE2 domain-containing sensor protein/tRNA A-37 threonylcarbamoyl transferase component Bud32
VRWSGRGWALVAVAVAAAAVALTAHRTGLLARAERTTIDARFSLRGTQRPPRGIVVVAIDQDSLARLPRFPFRRSLYAPVIDRLHAAGARVIAFDIEFVRPTTPAADDALIDAAGRARPVVFATTVIDRLGGTEVLGGPGVRRQVGAQVAATAALPDSSGVIRRVPYSVSGLRSFAVVIAALRTGRPVDREAFAHGGALIDYLGPARTFKTVPFVDVLRGRVAPSVFRGGEVIVGETAPSGQDLHPSPLGVLAGAEVQANALATILAGFPLRNAPGWVTAALIVTLALVAPLASVARRALVTLAAAVAALIVLAIGAQLAFDAGRIIDVTDSLVALGLASVATVAVDYALQDRERMRLRELFAAFSPDVVAEVLAQPGAPRRLGAPALSATRVIGGFRMEEVIGRGAMGVVYKATQLALARPVAVKVISPEHAASRVYRERFERESRLAASVEHASVIPVYEAGEDDGLLFIAMRYVDGVDLGVLVDRLGPLAPQRAAAIVAEVAGALDAAHERGLIHRDVKPANILLTGGRPEHAYLTDFGVAKITSTEDTAMTSPGQWVGTVDYIAPEQLRGESQGGGGDIYALGGVLYYALTGSVPYPRETDLAKLLAHVNAPPPIPSAHDPTLAAFDPVLARAMAKEPTDRFASAADLATAATKAAQAAEAV